MPSVKNKLLLSQLPKLDKLYRDARLKILTTRYPKKMVIEEIRLYLRKLRDCIIAGECESSQMSFDAIVSGFLNYASNRLENSLKRGVNGVGIILHTGMGRAPFAEEAQRALMDVVANYSTLQIDQNTGRRGDRYIHVEGLICKITGAEAALVVNNNAAATMLVLNALSSKKEAVVSRGHLIEIGGAFRIPDVMEMSGARLREVGTTNRTHLKDYAGAISEETGVILNVHMSNYAIIGFTKQVPIGELATLAHEHNLPMVDDLGSGALIDYSRYGLPYEPTVQESLKLGSDIVCFSGDKLLGGPQCGIIVGKKDLIEDMKANQLTRAFRCGKMTFAVLEATLRMFMDERKLTKHHPVISMIAESSEDVRKRCLSLKRRVKTVVGDAVKLRALEDVSEIGSGSMSLYKLPTWVLGIRSDDISTGEISRKFRFSNPPVFGRVKDGRFILDCRTIRHDEVRFVLKAAESVFGGTYNELEDTEE